MSAIRVIRTALLPTLLFGACIAPPLPYEPTQSQRTAPRTRLDLQAIAIRLGAHEGARQLQVEGTETGPLLLRGAGSRVLTENGKSESKLRIRAAEGEWLTLGDRVYEGELLIECHPRSGLHVTNLVDLEAYVRGVVAGESVLWSATTEELQVQAICARSYAVATLQERLASGAPAFLWDDTRDQVYLGAKTRATGARSGELERKLDQAITLSQARVLGMRNRVLDTRFHAACGGTTARFRDIFGEDSIAAQIPAVRCEPCAAATGDERNSNSWSFTASQAELARLAKKLQLGSALQSLRLVSADAYGRWLKIELTGDQYKRTISSTEFRRELGATRMYSTLVKNAWPRPGTQLERGLHLAGYGRGHGVGLCQVGSRSLARQGWSTTRILSHYYPGSRLGRVGPQGQFSSLTARFELE